jgi:hypothetical protein
MNAEIKTEVKTETDIEGLEPYVDTTMADAVAAGDDI